MMVYTAAHRERAWCRWMIKYENKQVLIMSTDAAEQQYTMIDDIGSTKKNITK